MSTMIDRPGIFRARPKDWKVKRFEGKKSVAITIQFALVEMMHENEWVSLEQYGEFHVYGDYFVIGKTGAINQTAVDQVVDSIGWSGKFQDIEAQRPPDVLVQVKVEQESYEGKARFKAGWLSPWDYQPGFKDKNPDGVRDLDTQFGSQMKAAAGGRGPKPMGRPAAPPPAAAKVMEDDGKPPF